MPSVQRVWTRDEVLAFPEDGKRYELLNGELLVSPSPSLLHQRAILALYERLAQFVRAERVGDVSVSPADLDLGDGDVSQPDLFVLALTAEGRAPTTWRECGVPLLVVEVLSPSTARFDRLVKRVRYQNAGVGEYWIVDVDARVVERWNSTDQRPQVLDETLVWRPAPAAPALTVDVAAYFADVYDERGTTR